MERFLTEILGPEGARALLLAVDRSPALASVLVPRAAVAWARAALASDHDGPVPGFPLASVLAKGGAWEVRAPDAAARGRDEEGLAAAVLVLAGVVPEGGTRTPPVRLARLGKNLDALVRARGLRKGKVDAPGPAARPLAPQKPDDPQEPTPPGNLKAAAPAAPDPAGDNKPAKRRIPKASRRAPKGPAGPKDPTGPKGPRQASLALSELATPCYVCGHSQLEAGKLTGCKCFSSLGRTLKAEQRGDRIMVKFGAGWDEDAIITFLQTVMKGHRA